MKHFLSFLLVLLAVIGCQATHAPPQSSRPPVMVPDIGEGVRVRVLLHADKDCDGDMRLAALLAANSFYSQTGGLADIRFKWDLDFDDPAGLNGHITYGNDLFLCHAGTEKELEEAGVPPNLLGWVGPNVPGMGIHNDYGAPSYVHIVASRLWSGNREAAILHEFGHLLGMSHSYKKGSVMYPSVDNAGSPTCLRRDDLESYCQVNDCGNTRVFPCE